jgi:hypothetical protein
MNTVRRFVLGLGLALAGTAAVHAAPPIGSGGGYYGSADSVGPTGSVVGPYATYADCAAALQAAINNQVNNHGEVVESVHPCTYRPPFSGVLHGLVGLDAVISIQSDTPGGSLDEATAVFEEVARIRQQYQSDRFDAEMAALMQPRSGR